MPAPARCQQQPADGKVAASAPAEPQEPHQQPGVDGEKTEQVVEEEDLPELEYRAPSGMDKFWTGTKLAFALPWRRFKKGSVLTIEVCICLVFV